MNMNQITSGKQARSLAKKGRNGDTELAHMTPGEVVIPRPLQTPELMQHARMTFDRAGVPMERYTVASSERSINPETGEAEYGFGSFLKKVASVALPVIGNAIAPGIGGVIGGAVGGAINGGGVQGALLGGLGGGLMSGNPLSQGFNWGASGAMGPLTLQNSTSSLFGLGQSLGDTMLGRGLYGITSGMGGLSPFMGDISKSLMSMSSETKMPTNISGINFSQPVQSDPVSTYSSGGGGGLPVPDGEGASSVAAASYDSNTGGGAPGGMKAGGGSQDLTSLPWQGNNSGFMNSVVPAPSTADVAPWDRFASAKVLNPQTGVQQFAAPKYANNPAAKSVPNRKDAARPKINPKTGVQEFAETPSSLSIMDYRAPMDGQPGMVFLSDGRVLPVAYAAGTPVGSLAASINTLPGIQNARNKPISLSSAIPKGFEAGNDSGMAWESYVDNYKGDLRGLGTYQGVLSALYPDAFGGASTQTASAPPPTTEPMENTTQQYQTPRPKANPLANVTTAAPPSFPSGQEAFTTARDAAMSANAPGQWRPSALTYLQRNPDTGAQEFFMKGVTTARGRDMQVYSRKPMDARPDRPMDKPPARDRMTDKPTDRPMKRPVTDKTSRRKVYG